MKSSAEDISLLQTDLVAAKARIQQLEGLLQAHGIDVPSPPDAAPTSQPHWDTTAKSTALGHDGNSIRPLEMKTLRVPSVLRDAGGSRYESFFTTIDSKLVRDCEEVRVHWKGPMLDRYASEEWTLVRELHSLWCRVRNEIVEMSPRGGAAVARLDELIEVWCLKLHLPVNLRDRFVAELFRERIPKHIRAILRESENPFVSYFKVSQDTSVKDIMRFFTSLLGRT